MSISTEGSDTPATRPETDKAGQSPRGRKGEGKLNAIEILNTVENHEWTSFKKAKNKLVCSSQIFK